MFLHFSRHLLYLTINHFKGDTFMLDNFLKLIKENFQTVITIATFSLTGLYGIICFLIYIYIQEDTVMH